MRFYIYKTVFFIVLIAFMWSLPIDLNAAGVGGEALPEAVPATASDKAEEAKAKALDVKHPMAGIIGKGGSGRIKSHKIRDYLNGKYKGHKKEPLFGGRADYRSNGSIRKIRIDGEFTPPGYAKRVDVDEDIRARSRAFLEEEKELLGLNDLENELGGGERIIRETVGRVLKDIRYHMEVEGLPVSGSTFLFVFTEAGEPVSMTANPHTVSPEMRAAAKRFRAEGLTVDDIKEALKADLVSRGVAQASIDGVNFQIGPHSSLVEEEPYAVWSTVVTYPGGYWAYQFNAITGEFISRESWISSEEE